MLTLSFLLFLTLLRQSDLLNPSNPSSRFCGDVETKADPSFHILIATAGRPSLRNLIDSFKYEMTANDAVTIVFDGKGAREKSGYTDDWFRGCRLRFHVIEQHPNLGAFGSAIRTKYQSLLIPRTTFIMHADDDDEYIKGSFNKLRRLCKDPDILYITKMNYNDNEELIIPRQNEQIILGDIGTPNGVVPFGDAGKADWGLRYGGDFDYYSSLQTKVKGVVFLEEVIYTVHRRD
jgi:hypothetical protein